MSNCNAGPVNQNRALHQGTLNKQLDDHVGVQVGCWAPVLIVSAFVNRYIPANSDGDTSVCYSPAEVFHAGCLMLACRTRVLYGTNTTTHVHITVPEQSSFVLEMLKDKQQTCKSTNTVWPATCRDVLYTQTNKHQSIAQHSQMADLKSNSAVCACIGAHMHLEM